MPCSACHHSALELLGAAHSAWRECTVFTARRRKDLQLGDRRIRFLQVPAAMKGGEGQPLGSRRIEHRGKLLACTGPERTLVEGFRRPSLVGGHEELLVSAGGFTALDLGLLEAVLRRYGAAKLWAATGWFLERYRNRFHVSEDVLRRWEKEVPASPQYLERCAAESGFSVATLEKVARLGKFAGEVGRHPFLREALALKGGTALNPGYGAPTRSLCRCRLQLHRGRGALGHPWCSSIQVGRSRIAIRWNTRGSTSQGSRRWWSHFGHHFGRWSTILSTRGPTARYSGEGGRVFHGISKKPAGRGRGASIRFRACSFRVALSLAVYQPFTAQTRLRAFNRGGRPASASRSSGGESP